jgi:hypothetical protein
VIEILTYCNLCLLCVACYESKCTMMILQASVIDSLRLRILQTEASIAAEQSTRHGAESQLAAVRAAKAQVPLKSVYDIAYNKCLP